ncbi:unnamed protein product [Pseudo-nitzschia multistriata]|uniref:DUF6697 domain-containing protein n=1 Tax=Pseudo-nitzschia multistriata TaxID=183589 RepID=A0A448Z1Y8_9STRA|nr:unnamed protein product [Pseudo-nitzschia multistriata]
MVKMTTAMVSPSPSKKRKFEANSSSGDDGGDENEHDLRFRSNKTKKEEITKEEAMTYCPVKVEGNVSACELNNENSGVPTDPIGLVSDLCRPTSYIKTTKKEETTEEDTAIETDENLDGVKSEDIQQHEVSNLDKIKKEESDVTDHEVKRKERPEEQTSSSVEVKKEEAKVKLEVARAEAYEKYADRPLLHRFFGIGLLGGGHQNTYVRPSKKCTKVFDGHEIRKGYPAPKINEKKNANGNDVGAEYDMDTFAYCAFNTLRQFNGPKFAGQPTAAMSKLSSFLREKNLSFPIFMKRSLTKKNESEQKVLGWEYVGNYRCSTDKDIMLWESAKNISEATKRQTKEDLLRYAACASGHGRAFLDKWKAYLDKEVEKDHKNAREGKQLSQSTIGARAKKLTYRKNLTDNDLIGILLELDEFYGQEIIEFVEYDERIYDFCSKGLTTKNSNGEIKAKKGGDHATARDCEYSVAATYYECFYRNSDRSVEEEDSNPIFSSQPWQEDTWTAADDENARLILENHIEKCSISTMLKSSGSSLIDEGEDANAWDQFYSNHGNRFFKDRHYFEKAFPEEFPSSSAATNSSTSTTRDDGMGRRALVEIGCGVGNAILPLLEVGDSEGYWDIVHGLDISREAIQILRKDTRFVSFNETGASKRKVFGHVCDISMELPPPCFGISDVTTLIFCLSAIDPASHAEAAKHVVDTLKPGGVLVFRDYGRYDEAQMKLGTSRSKRIKENFYRKHDGTKCYYFQLEDLQNLFCDLMGMQAIELQYLRRVYGNRATTQVRRRIWVQGRFRKPLQSESD